MELVTVSLSKAIICFATACHPVLIGKTTPVGEYQLQVREVSQVGYGGEVLQFKEDDQFVWAIHRVYTANPSEMRMMRLRSPTATDNTITNGCLNVMPEVYVELKNCCSSATLRIEE